MQLHIGGYLSFYMPGKQTRFDLGLEKPTPLKEILQCLDVPLGEVQLVIHNQSIVNLQDAVIRDQDMVKIYSSVDGG